MTTTLMRRDLRPLYEAARDAHPGLLLQRGLPERRDEDNKARTKHIARVARWNRIDGFYRRAYERWKRATIDEGRFRSVVLNLETRLFIGLTGGGMMETGCAIAHSHGAPYIPGSSVKGVVNAHARERFDTTEEGRAIRDELFGVPPAGDWSAGLSGAITFHDAWWAPGSAETPLTPEVVTTHHPNYYGKDGCDPETDFDSPVPNAQIAVRGGFLFVIEGPSDWLELTEQMLVSALTVRGAGAKTRTGYGLFRVETTDTPPSVPIRKGDAVEATLYKDDGGRWCGRTDDGQEGTVFARDAAPDDAVEGGARTLYVRVARPLEFQWVMPEPKPGPRGRSKRPRRR